MKKYKCCTQPKDSINIDIRSDIVCLDMHTALGTQQIVLTKHKAKQMTNYLVQKLYQK